MGHGAVRSAVALGLAKAKQEAEERRPREQAGVLERKRQAQFFQSGDEPEQLESEKTPKEAPRRHSDSTRVIIADRSASSNPGSSTHDSSSGRSHGGSSGSFDGAAIYAQRHEKKNTANREILSRGIDLIGTAAVQAQRSMTGISVSSEQQLAEARRQQENARTIYEANEQYKRANRVSNWSGRDELIDEYRRLQAGSNLASDGTRYSRQAREDRLKEIHAELKERDLAAGNGARNYSAFDDAAGVVSGTGKSIASSGVNLFSNLGQLMAEADAYSYSENEFLTDWMLGNDPNAMRQRKIDAYESDGAKAFWSSVDAVADKLGGDAAEAIQRAKEGKSFLGELGIDAAKSTLEMGFDAGLAALSGGSALVPMAARVYGQSVGQARQAGATLEKQAACGLTSAGIEVLSEKLFDGVAKIYGAGAADDLVEKLVVELAESDTGRGMLRFLAGAAGEGAEEVVSDLLSPLAEATYRDESLAELYRQLDPADLLYSFMIGAAISTLASGASAATRQSAEASPEYRANEAEYLNLLERKGLLPPESSKNAAPVGTVEDSLSSGVLSREKQKSNGLQSFRENDRIKSISISGALNPDSKRAKAHATLYYESVRHMQTDVQRIAKNTGFSESDITQIKQFIFMDEHDLGENGIRRFFPSFEMAQSWQRLIDGKHIQPHDLTLLHHEIFERQLMLEGKSQEEAHIRASEVYNFAKECKEFYDKAKKHKEK